MSSVAGEDSGTIPQLAVIILTINQKAQTLRCLKSLAAQEPGDFDVGTLVWDNGSADGTDAAIAEEYPDVIVAGSRENLGVAGGRNAAARVAQQKLAPHLLLFLDNDMVLEPGFVAALARRFREDPAGRVGQVQAKLRLGDAPERLNDGGGCRLQFWLGRTRPVGYGEVDLGQRDEPRQCICCGGAMMVRSEVFRELGGFDETFNPFGPEDLDFSLRLQKAGYEAWYEPQAVAYHDVNHTFGGDYSEDYASHRARHWMRLMRRHAGVMDWLGFILIGAPAIGLRVLFREGRKGNLGALRGLLAGTLKRR